MESLVSESQESVFSQPTVQPSKPLKPAAAPKRPRKVRLWILRDSMSAARMDELFSPNSMSRRA
jgi:hypothetical protein